ncbi:MAG: amidohydrolase [Deltaproteobacteria bacterium]|jgi:5-methylthioadenosine/S-adenosylhomocysteine deaminase|nr:amidohydrolase [Deltaproteobacteria bacterium]
MKNCELLISADYILTQNLECPLLEKAAVAIDAGLIVAIGEAETLKQNFRPAKSINLGRALIMPGLVNAHTHIPMTLLRGVADDLQLMEWLNKHIWPLEAKFNTEILQAGSLLACAEMLRTGTTAFLDMYINEAPIFRTVDSTGMKALVGEGIIRFPSLASKDGDEALELARSQAEELKGNPRIRCCISPHSVYTTTLELLEKCAALAEELDLPMHIHLAETKDETAQSLELNGCRPVEQCRRAGILGSRTTVAHAVDLTEEEIALFASTGTVVAHNPRSNMKLASGAAPVSRMLEKGVRVGLGTDGAASNNALNMFTEMSSCALMHKLVHLNPTTMPAQTVLNLATLGGAEALHWPGLGQLAQNGPADLIALDLNAPNLTPFNDPVSHLVYAASGHEVILSMVDGRVLYENGNFLSLDYPALIKEVEDIRIWLKKHV